MQKKSTDFIIGQVAQYYSDKLAKFGLSPLGVDWNGEAAQLLRFEQLCKIIGGKSPFSLIDVGCGYGSLVDYLKNNYEKFSYLGLDVSEDMIDAGKKKYQVDTFCKFEKAQISGQTSDYCVASGIFSVKLNNSDAQWREYLEDTLDTMNRSSGLGFSFNCLTIYSEKEKMRKDLYYANPCDIFDLCKKKYSKQVALLHDYGLYEFTILVRK